jgi:hypothetical protein
MCKIWNSDIWRILLIMVRTAVGIVLLYLYSPYFWYINTVPAIFSVLFIFWTYLKHVLILRTPIDGKDLAFTPIYLVVSFIPIINLLIYGWFITVAVIIDPIRKLIHKIVDMNKPTLECPHCYGELDADDYECSHHSTLQDCVKCGKSILVSHEIAKEDESFTIGIYNTSSCFEKLHYTIETREY